MKEVKDLGLSAGRAFAKGATILDYHGEPLLGYQFDLLLNTVFKDPKKSHYAMSLEGQELDYKSFLEYNEVSDMTGAVDRYNSIFITGGKTEATVS